MKQTTVYNKTEADTDIENKLVVISGEREGGGERWGRGLRGTNYYV